MNTTIMTRTIQTTNRSGSFSAKADYTPLDNGNVEISEWTFDTLGILAKRNRNPRSTANRSASRIQGAQGKRMDGMSRSER